MLMDVLGIVIAFITIILLLSIVVTAVVQASQAVLRLRGRNLLIGLAAAIVNQRKGNAERTSYRDRFKAKLDALKVLSSRSLNPLSGAGVKGSNRLWWLKYYLIGPKVSRIDAQDLPAGLQQLGGFSNEAVREIQSDFERLEPHVSKRFEKVARGWSLAWAVVVAFLLQVSTPALLNKLATNTEYRDRILANTDQDLAYAREAMTRLDYESAAATALEQLANRHPELRERIEQASGVGTNKEFIVDELRLAVEGVPQQQELVQEYEILLDEMAVSEAETVAGETLGRLATYDIRLWPGGWGFYYKQPGRATDGDDPSEPRSRGLVVPGGADWRNITGVLITAILLTLGAPFWFDVLKNVAGLRDRLTGKVAPESSSGAVLLRDMERARRPQSSPQPSPGGASTKSQAAEKPSLGNP